MSDRLKRIFEEAISDPEVAGLSIATRPDCISEDMLRLLCELNKEKPVWIELGLQTIHERSAAYIRRGYALSVFDDTMKRLTACEIEVVVHAILGLPFESPEDMVETVRYIGKSGAKGIKLQLLHVLKNTDLEAEYRKGNFEVLSMEEYIDMLDDGELLEITPASLRMRKQILDHTMRGRADFKKKHFHSCNHIRSLYYAMPFSMWKEHNEVINEMVKSVGAGLIVVGDVSPTVVIKAALRDVKPLTTQELINYMRIGCLKWCARAWYK